MILLHPIIFLYAVCLCVATAGCDYILVIHEPHSHPHDMGDLIVSINLSLYFLVSTIPILTTINQSFYVQLKGTVPDV